MDEFVTYTEMNKKLKHLFILEEYLKFKKGNSKSGKKGNSIVHTAEEV